MLSAAFLSWVTVWVKQIAAQICQTIRCQKMQKKSGNLAVSGQIWLRGKDLNQRPPGYEPDELPTALPRDIDALNWCLYRIAQRRKIVKQNLSTLCDFFRRFGNSLHEITRKSVISPQSCAYAPRRPCRPRGRSSKGRSSRPRRQIAAYRSRRIARHRAPERFRPNRGAPARP